jgi:hemolysin activation/secretion protein
VIGSARAYTSIPLWGHARHALGVRGVYGWAESNGTTLFSVGGVSGTSLEIVPGYSVGDSPRTFFVRGFRPGALAGTRAWSGTAEYRAPLTRIGRGLWPLPVFFQRVAVAAFGDAGSAWCPAIEEATLVCPAGGTSRRTIMSAGAELLMDATLDYDDTNRFRLGFAMPVRGRDNRTKEMTVYFSLGLPF